MFMEPGKTSIRTVRATGRAPDRLALQMRLERTLSGLELRPTHLPAAAILCIRRLRALWPLAWQRHGHDVHRPRTWERAITGAIDELLQHAARPATGAVPDSAEAVVFADYAELLTCLAADWCAGDVTTHWWWHSFLQGTDVDQAVLHAWHEAPPYIPAALQHLAERGQAVPFARSLNVQAARRIVYSLTQCFALPALQTVLEAILRHEPRQAASCAWYAASTTERVAPSSPQPIVLADRTEAPEAPWQPWAPESTDRGLHLAQQCLLGLGLMLQRAPTLVRALTFALAVQQWWDAVPQLPASHSATARVSTMTLPAGTSAWEAPGGHVERQLTPQSEDSTAATYTLQPEERTGSPESALDLGGLTSPTPEVASLVLPPGHHQTSQEAATPVPQTSHATLVPAAPADSQTPEACMPPDTHIETALGGVFYLINLGLFLQLYGDFTTPAHPGLPLSVWDFVALLGQQLVGDTIYADPVWPLLAHLAGRTERQAPGTHFQPPDVWRVPAAWLEPFPAAGLWDWDTARGRLRVQHPEQFLVLDVPCEGNSPLQQLQDELQVYSATSAFELQHAALASSIDGASPLERWLAWLMPYVRVRLQCALGLADADELARVVCEHQAHICVTATHLDIFLALETLPIALRCAGLDRDAGWVPAAGRYIAFHFE